MDSKGLAILKAIGEYLNRDTLYIDHISEPGVLSVIVQKELDEFEIRRQEEYYEKNTCMGRPF